MPKIIDKTICVKCKKNPPHRQNTCRPCLAAYARANYQKNFKAEPSKGKPKYVKATLWGFRGNNPIRQKSAIRKSLSATFGAQPEKKYRAGDILKGAKHV